MSLSSREFKMALAAAEQIARSMQPFIEMATQAQRAYEAHAERVADLVTVAHQVANAVQPMLESIAKVQSVFAAHAQELARIGAVLHPLLKAIAEADKS